MAGPAKTASGKILHNSMWYGLETVVETVVFVGSSIVVARYLGKTKLGEYQFINFFVNIVTRTSGSGLASATRRYMAEFLAVNDPGRARAVYRFTYGYQLLGSCCVTALALAAVLLYGDPAYRTMSVILILSLIPGVMSWVPAQANQAFQDVSGNTLSAFAYLVTYVVVIGLTLHFKWDLVGVALATTIGRGLEMALRTVPLHARLRRIPLEALPRELIQRIRRYCLQAIGLQLLTSIVWDRSEVLLLRLFSTLDQIALYSVSFSFSANLLMLPRIFGSATGITLLVESLREPGRVRAIVATASRFLLLVVLPVHLGAIAVTGPAIRYTYGQIYAGAVPVLMVAALLSIPRGFQELPETLLRAAERQSQLLKWMVITGAVNLALDLLLIPRYAAVGAAWGNGLAQAFGIVAIWRQARRFYDFRFPVISALRLGAAALGMSLAAHAAVRVFRGPVALALVILAAGPLYVLLIRLFRGLEPRDGERLRPIANRLPSRLRGAYLATVAFTVGE